MTGSSPAVVKRLAEIAEFCGAQLRGGDGDAPVSGVGTLHGATPGDVSFLANPRYRASLASTRATAVLVHPDAADDCPVAALVHEQPYLAFARVSRLLHPERRPGAGIDAAASVSPGATVAPTAHVGDAGSTTTTCWTSPFHSGKAG